MHRLCKNLPTSIYIQATLETCIAYSTEAAMKKYIAIASLWN